MNEIIYKYTDLTGAKFILGDLTLKFSHYSELNDPFDAYFSDMFGMDWNEVAEQNGLALHKALEGNNPEAFSRQTGIPLDQAKKACDLYSGLPPEYKENFLKIAQHIEANDPALMAINLQQQIQTEAVKHQFDTTGIFCGTYNKNNLLMWAHYADKHRGVVIGLKPDVSKDSALVHMRPVTYTDERPNFVEQSEVGSGKTSAQLAEESFYRVLFTKGTDWQYEQEIRMAIPMVIPIGKKMWLMNVHPTEIVEVYLGCRLDAHSTEGEAIINLAKATNPNVHLFQTKTAKRYYQLHFEPIEQS